MCFPIIDKVKLIKKDLTWENALEYCRDKHDDLVSITNLHQQRWVEKFMKDVNSTWTSVWLGLRYTCTLDLWFWVNDKLVCYQNWDLNNGKNECYLAVGMSRSSFRWTKTPTTQPSNFMCIYLWNHSHCLRAFFSCSKVFQ